MKTLNKPTLSILLVLVFCCTAQAGPIFLFDNISGNSAIDAATGEAQLFVEVIDLGGGQTLFDFFNTGPLASSITDIYFDDGPLLSIAVIDDSDPGVSFSLGASPGNLPSANNASPPFVATIAFSTESNPPAQPNGINPGESLGITFDLIVSNTFDDVITALLDGSLRIGIHVQGFAGGGSESFVNDGIIPAPSAIVLCGLGTAFVGWLRRSRRI